MAHFMKAHEKYMARKPRHAEHERLVGRNSEPLVIEMDRPGTSWTPIRFAPLRFQAVATPMGKRTLTGEAIEAFVGEAVKDPSIIKCKLAFFEFLAIHFTPKVGNEEVTELIHVLPHAPREWTDSYDGTARGASEDIVDLIVAMWARMEGRFRSAHRLGDCRVLARCGSPVAEHFTSGSRRPRCVPARRHQAGQSP